MISSDLLLVLASLGLFQGVILSLYLLTLKQGNKQANLLLGLALLGLTIRIGKSVCEYLFVFEYWQTVIGLSGMLIVGPCLLLYGRGLIQKQFFQKRSDLLHFIPFMAFILVFLILSVTGPIRYFWNYSSVLAHLGAYLLSSWVLLVSNGDLFRTETYRWYRNILFGTSLIWLFYIGNLLGLQINYITGPIFYSFLVYAFSYLLLNRKHFKIDKYAKSTLDKNLSSELLTKIYKLFEVDRVYLDPDISVKKVAEKLDENPRQISQAINENEGKNFYEFVNFFRIEKAKGLLTDNEYAGEKIATIAYESGFNNVTSFNLAFKKIIGKTPSEFRKTVSS